jgi:hypothetical protein
MKYRVSKKFISIVLVIILLLPGAIMAQNRGNTLGFQGLDELVLPSTRVASLGGAFTAMSGDINSLYLNSAGLSGLQKMSISFTTNATSRTWMENQIYRPNRRFVTLPFYLEGLYVPDPANNGLWDQAVFYDGLGDTAYVVSLPDTGLMAYSKEAADWEYKQAKFAVSDISFALPMTVLDRTLTLALGIRPQTPIQDYDRNETYLAPHMAYTEYDMIPQLDGTDTVRMNWYDFERSREGSVFSINMGVGMEILSWLSAGFNLEYMSGSTNDRQVKTKIGYFDLFDDNEFMFSYDTLTTLYVGTSQFSSFKSAVGLLLNNEHVSVGLNLNMPYQIKRTYSYLKTVTDTLGFTNSEVSGSETLKVPLGYSLGFVFKPVENFLVSVDVATTPYSNAVWTLGDDLGELQRSWVNQKTLAFGAELKPLPYLALRAGYRNVRQVFVPDGAAIRTEGPEKISWSFGLGYQVGKLGCIDIAYVMSDLKYYDQYFSNINYVSDKADRWMVGYSLSF